MRIRLFLGVGLGLLAAASYGAAQELQGGRGLQLPNLQPGFPGLRTGNLDYKEIIPPLIEALKDSDTEVRQSAASALVHIGQPAVSTLMDILKDKEKDKELRANVAYVLGQMGMAGQEAMPILVKALKDDDRDVRRRAAYAIQNIIKANNESGGMMPGMAGLAPGGFQPGGIGVSRGPVLRVPDPGVVPPPGPTPLRLAEPANPVKKDEKKEDKKDDKR